jgi:hypothetical protein
MWCEQLFTSRALLHEGEADTPFAAPNGAAIPHDIVA